MRLGIGALCAAPLAALLGAAFRRPRQWGAWVAILLIPYFTLGLGALLVTPERNAASLAFVLLTLVTLFAGIASARGR
ncbi:MAG: DUF2069 domain-containing protein [Gammaproteobacteria bacterium]|nr:DUF2069 domain-containing protein [Gammaproteobacteria bacterium]